MLFSLRADLFRTENAYQSIYMVECFEDGSAPNKGIAAILLLPSNCSASSSTRCAAVEDKS